MQIKELVIKNFKSFKYSTIPFKEGFHVIVGPNGSGKSNIIDALLFVFGSTSLKRLRVDKLCNLVNHNSSSNTARVRVVFEHNNEDYEIVREIDKDGKSIFYLNEKRKALNEITSFLEDIGISSDGYNTVQQGDVTKITSMNSQERRTIIEDISGISLFDSRKKEAEDNLKKVNKRLEKVSIALNERKPYVEQLASERQAALKYKELDSTEQILTINLYNKQIEELNSQKEQLVSDLDLYDEKIQIINDSKRELLEKQNNLEQELEDINSKLIEHSEVVQNTVGKRISELRAEKEILLNNRNLKQENLDYLIKENNNSANMLSELKNKKEDLLKIIEEQKQKKEEKVNSKNLLKKQIDESNSEYENLRNLQKELYDKLSNINKTINELQNTYFSKKNKISAYTLQKEQLEKESLKVKEESIILKEKENQLNKDITSLRKEISDLEENINNYNLKIKELETSKEEIQLKVNKNLVDKEGIKKELSIYSNINSRKKELSEKLNRFNTFVDFLDNLVKLDSEQKSYFSNYVVLDNENELESIIKELDTKANLSYVILSSINCKKDNLDSFVNNKFNISTSSKLKKIKGFYFDGFSYKKILFKDSKDLEHSLSLLEDENNTLNNKLNEINEKLNEYKNKINTLNSNNNSCNVTCNTKLELLDDICDKIQSCKMKSTESINTKTIVDNIEVLEEEVVDIDDQLTSFKTQKQDVEEQLNSIDLGKQSNLRDSFDDVVSEVNILEQSLISKESEINIISEKIESKIKYIENNNSKVDSIKVLIEDYEDKEVEINNKLNELNRELEIQNSKKQGLYNKREEFNLEVNNISTKINRLDQDIMEYNSNINSINIELSSNNSKISQIENNISMLDFDIKNIEKIEKDISEINSELRNIRREKNALGNINFNAIDSYDKLAKEYDDISQKYDILIEEKEKVSELLGKINMQKQTVFVDCFEKINKEFKDIISKMSKNLTGSLELIGEDVLDSKLNINLIKNSKKKNIDIMSGGEKTVTALAFIFAINAYKKLPFYILDEVDAALDDYNSKSLMNYIKVLSKSSAIISITHNSNIVSGADQIIGVTLKENSSIIGLGLKN